MTSIFASIATGFSVPQRLGMALGATEDVASYGTKDLGMLGGLIDMSQVIATLLFIITINAFTAQHSAKRGNIFGMIGMMFAVLSTCIFEVVKAYHFQTPIQWVIVALAACTLTGGIIGLVMAVRVSMQGMPGLIALLNAFGGVAATLEGIGLVCDPTFIATEWVAVTAVDRVWTRIYTWFGVVVGSVTFFGSIIAQLKLLETPLWNTTVKKMEKQKDGSMKEVVKKEGVWFPQGSKRLPGRFFWECLMYIGMGATLVAFMLMRWKKFYDMMGHTMDIIILGVGTVISALWAVSFVMNIGGADMPVVVSVLNSFSGWAGCLTGFMMDSNLLIIAGTMVGASGTILSALMCRAMNRSIMNVLIGGFGESAAASEHAKAYENKPFSEIHPEGFARMLMDSNDIVIVPGYGMAAARAQGPVAQLHRMLTEAGKKVRYAIHPVAGRLPGHMNVLLAEADIPYDVVAAMDDINPELPNCDLSIVIGANDIVNPLALEDPKCAIGGMPVIRCWDAKKCVVLKRSMGGKGYANLPNPLFHMVDKSYMYLGDAAKQLEQLLVELSKLKDQH